MVNLPDNSGTETLNFNKGIINTYTHTCVHVCVLTCTRVHVSTHTCTKEASKRGHGGGLSSHGSVALAKYLGHKRLITLNKHTESD